MQFPNLDGNLSTPLLKTVYLGHPAAMKFDGKSLAKYIVELFKEFDFTLDGLRLALCGGVFDGQYLHLGVMGEIGGCQYRY